MKQPIIPPGVKNVLVIMTDYHLGDFIMALPTIEALAAYFDHGISLVVRQNHRPLVERLPSAGKLTIYSYVAGRKVRTLGQNYTFFRLGLQLLAKRFQVVFCVSYRISCSMLALLTFSPHRIGLASSRRKWVFNDLLSPFNAVHKLDFYATVLERIGLHGRPAVVGPLPEQQERDSVHKILAAMDGSDNRFAVLHPFSGKAVRSWSQDKFIAVADFLTLKLGLKVCLIGAPGERGKLEEMRLAVKEPAMVAVVAESMGITLALLSEMTLFLGNLSGPAHLAGLVSSAPIICISGPTDKQRWSPPAQSDQVVMLSGEVCPGKCKKEDCQLDARCIHQVQVAEVLTAIEAFAIASKISPD